MDRTSSNIYKLWEEKSGSGTSISPVGVTVVDSGTELPRTTPCSTKDVPRQCPRTAAGAICVHWGRGDQILPKSVPLRFTSSMTFKGSSRSKSLTVLFWNFYQWNCLRTLILLKEETASKGRKRARTAWIIQTEYQARIALQPPRQWAQIFPTMSSLSGHMVHMQIINCNKKFIYSYFWKSIKHFKISKYSISAHSSIWVQWHT